MLKMDFFIYKWIQLHWIALTIVASMHIPDERANLPLSPFFSSNWHTTVPSGIWPTGKTLPTVNWATNWKWTKLKTKFPKKKEKVLLCFSNCHTKIRSGNLWIDYQQKHSVQREELKLNYIMANINTQFKKMQQQLFPTLFPYLETYTYLYSFKSIPFFPQ
jgi:hypothetical protein